MLEKELDEIRENIDKIREDRRLQRFPLIRLPFVGESLSIHSRFCVTKSTGMSIIEENIDMTKVEFYKYGKGKFWQGFFLGVGITSCLTCCALYLEGVYRSSRCESKSEIRSENEIDREAYFDIGKKEGLK